MGDEAMLEAELDMSLDDLIAKGSKFNQPPKRSEKRGSRTSGRPRDSKKDASLTDAMDVDISAPKRLSVTIQNVLKPQGGVAKKKSAGAPRTNELFRNAAKAISQTDGKPRPRVDLDSVTWTHDMYKPEGPQKPRTMSAPRGGSRGTGRSRDQVRARAPEPRPQAPGKMTKLMISNLADEVDNSDIKELFLRIGAVKSAAITYDRTNRPTGFAEVVYHSEADAQKAYDAYQGVALDGKKMAIKIIAERVPEDGSFRLSSGLEVSGRRGSQGTFRGSGGQPRGRGTSGRLKSSAQAFDIDDDDENME